MKLSLSPFCLRVVVGDLLDKVPSALSPRFSLGLTMDVGRPLCSVGDGDGFSGGLTTAASHRHPALPSWCCFNHHGNSDGTQIGGLRSP